MSESWQSSLCGCGCGSCLLGTFLPCLSEEISEDSTTSKGADVAIVAPPFGAPAVQPFRTTMK
ncbi:unnamed protein product [Clonostachys rosea f. rosea IK726]|uniref:Uncharacterized protein n=2 Tax=Bionectria ochroleuca TaxID=29856 RepID=A0A0B7KAC3_BIOOC|nr:unnamed protein product [Clonostachys rosea f. rosea IK726]